MSEVPSLSTTTKILILGSGGREHALVTKLLEEVPREQIYCCPGNAGIATDCQVRPISATDFAAIAKLISEEGIDWVIPGSEVALVEGIADYLGAIPSLGHVQVIGPSRAAAQLEGSKDFSKDLMLRYGIPTAQAKTFTAGQWEEALAYLRSRPLPIVLKADGLAAGKGVIIATSLPEAEQALKEMLTEGKFGKAADKVLIEDYLDGIECSYFALCDGTSYVLLPEAKDYKRIGVGDTGPNTGGMGAVSPVPFASARFTQAVIDEVLTPTLAAMQKEGHPFRGFLFIGLMQCQGRPFVIEYNVRLGDPETEAILMRLDESLAGLCQQIVTGQMTNRIAKAKSAAACTVVLAAEGYPENYEKGDAISGIDGISESYVFHAGTIQKDGAWLTNGGRVLAVTSLGDSLSSAREASMRTAKAIRWKGRYYREDIGLDLLNWKQD